MLWILLAPWFWASSAGAVTCDEAILMIDKNVPANIVASTIEGSGHTYSPDELACLEQADMPEMVLEAARNSRAPAVPPKAASPEPTTLPSPQPEPVEPPPPPAAAPEARRWLPEVLVALFAMISAAVGTFVYIQRHS